MEARTSYFNFMGQKWTVETNADFSFSEKCPVPAVVATQQGKETEFYLTITKPSLDENEKKEIKKILVHHLICKVVESKFGKYVLINKQGEKSTEGGKMDWENVLDGDLLYCIAEKNEEIQTALAEVYKEVMDFVETM